MNKQLLAFYTLTLSAVVTHSSMANNYSSYETVNVKRGGTHSLELPAHARDCFVANSYVPAEIFFESNYLKITGVYGDNSTYEMTYQCGDYEGMVDVTIDGDEHQPDVHPVSEGYREVRVKRGESLQFALPNDEGECKLIHSYVPAQLRFSNGHLNVTNINGDNSAYEMLYQCGANRYMVDVVITGDLHPQPPVHQPPVHQPPVHEPPVFVRPPMKCEVQTGGGKSASVEVHERHKSDFAYSYILFGHHHEKVAQVFKNHISEDGKNKHGLLELDWEGRQFGFNPRSVKSVAAVDRHGNISNKTTCVRRNVSPIALDIDYSGKVERIDGKFEFDFSANGEKQVVSQWFAPSEGILVDTRIQGEITGQHLFGDMNGKFRDGYAKLATLDANKDSQISGVELQHLGVWTDANSNAKLDVGELSTLAQHGVMSLNTTHANYESTATLVNGATIVTADLWFPVLAAGASSSTVVESVATVASTSLSKTSIATGLAGFLIATFSGFMFWRRRQHSTENQA